MGEGWSLHDGTEGTNRTYMTAGSRAFPSATWERGEEQVARATLHRCAGFLPRVGGSCGVRVEGVPACTGPRMSVPPDIEARGLTAYEQARAFERLRGWRLPVSYGVFVLLPVVLGIFAWIEGRTVMAVVNGLVALFLVVVSGLHCQRLKMRYGENLRLLAELEEKYGDQLPWVQVEKHFAALEELKREVSEGGP